MKELIRLYKKFNRYYGENFSEDVKSWLGVSELKLSNRIIKKVYRTFYRHTFIEFCKYVRDLVYSKNPFNFIKETNKENWDLWYYLSFLKSEGLIKIKNNQVVPEESLKQKFVRRYSEREVLIKLKKIGKIDEKQPTFKLIKKLSKHKFRFKPKLDQLPISIESAANLIATIFKYYPLYDNFLFVGDDDFISLLIIAVEPKFSPVVSDLDEEILKTIQDIDERIKTVKRDFSKRRKIEGKFLGFCTNPPYTEDGIETFVKFGMMHFDELGGRIFLEFGNESIGRRLLFLQQFFTKNNLEITEVIKGKINYPFMVMHPEDKIIYDKLSRFFDKEKIKNNYMLGADIYVLTYIPWCVKRIKLKGKKIYSYI